MQTIRALIVDDEPVARDGIRVLLQNDSEVEVAGECANGHEAVRAIRETAPDLVFLDVQMPELDGFGVIEEVGTQFEVRLEDRSVRVRLREGAVVVHHDGRSDEVHSVA